MTTAQQVLDAFVCKGLCHAQCTIVPMSAAEITALQEASGLTFSVDPLPVLGEPRVLTIVPKGELRCPALTADNRCAGYAARPAICRLFGVVPKLPCPHGCRPLRWLTVHEAARMLELTP